jgi:uncharacterized protein DUF4190
VTYPTSGGTPDPYQPQQPYDPTAPYQPAPAYDPTTPYQSEPPASGQPAYGSPAPVFDPAPAYGPPAFGPPAYGPQGYGPPPGYGTPGYGPPMYPQAMTTNTLAILALVFAFVFAPASIVLGHLAKKQIRQTGEQGEGLAVAGLWLGYIFTGLGLLFCIGYIVIIVVAIGSSSTTGNTI